jgi:hypothetical protein
MGRETRCRKTIVGAQKHMGAMKKENKSGWSLGGRESQISGCCKEKAGGSVQPFGKFSKVGSVNACMKRKQNQWQLWKRKQKWACDRKQTRLTNACMK